MEGAIDPRLHARQPQQARSRRRFEEILDEARNLLVESGLSVFSIPTLAERLGYIRATIYQYFPTPHALLNELLKRELHDLEALLNARSADAHSATWQSQLAHIVNTAADFHNARPVARMLILGGPISDESHMAQALNIRHLGGLARGLLENAGFALPSEPDVAVIAVDIGTTCFRIAFHQNGRITPAYREEAMRAMQAYLALYAPAAS